MPKSWIPQELLGKKVVAVRTDSETEITAIHLEGGIKILALGEMISKKDLSKQVEAFGDVEGITFHFLKPGE